MLLVLALTTILGAASTLMVLRDQADASLVVDVAGRQRMLSQRLTKEALLLASASENERTDRRETLAGTAALFDRTLRALRDGGETLGTSGAEVMLPGSTGNALDAFQEVTRIWEPIQAAIDTLTESDVVPGSDEFSDALSVLVERNLDLLTSSNAAVVALGAQSEQGIRALQVLQISFAALALLLAMVSILLIRRWLLMPLRATSQVTLRMADGYIDQEVEERAQGEMGEMNRAMQTFSGKLREIVETLSSIADSVAGGSRELSKGAGQLSEGANANASSTEEVSASMEQMDSSIQQNADNAQEISAASAEQRSGSRQVNSSILELEQVGIRNASQAEEMAGMAEELSGQAEQMQSTIAFFQVNGEERTALQAPEQDSENRENEDG